MAEALKCESLAHYRAIAVSATGTLRTNKMVGRVSPHRGRFALWYHKNQ
jgi:hypothetical protein